MLLKYAEIPLAAIVTDETARDPGKHLVKSMRDRGLLLPILVRQVDDATYHLIDGSRRYAGAIELGWTTIPALIEPADAAGDPKDLKAIVLNTQRKNLQQLYVARHVKRLMKEQGCTLRELAQELQMGRSTLHAMVRVLDCPDLEAACREGNLEFGAAKAMAPLPPDERAALMAELRKIERETGRFPSVRAVELLVQQRQGRPAVSPPTDEALPEVIKALREHGVLFQNKIGFGKQSVVRVAITLGEADEDWIADLISQAP